MTWKDESFDAYIDIFWEEKKKHPYKLFYHKRPFAMVNFEFSEKCLLLKFLRIKKYYLKLIPHKICKKSFTLNAQGWEKLINKWIGLCPGGGVEV